MTEQQWDKKLNIDTIGRDDSHSDQHHHPYEPTPYSVLERLAESGYITSRSKVVDYGCGKGRVGFFLYHAVGCNVVGIEFDRDIWDEAIYNLSSSKMGGKVRFINENAEDFIPTDADCFYFFNPFTVEILQAVMRRIVDSYYETPRDIKLFFYYPDDEYLSFLLAGDSDGLTDELYFVDEIDCRDLFDGANEQERIMIFEMRGNCY